MADEYDIILDEFNILPNYLIKGQNVTIEGTIKNRGIEISTVYIIIRLVNPYNRNEIIFDSHRDISDDDKYRYLRVVDILPRNESAFRFDWKVPLELNYKQLILKIEIWNPHKLMEGNYPLMFDESVWKSVDVIDKMRASDMQIETKPKHIFIGHGRSTVWRNLKDFLQDRLQLPYDEFNRESVAGIATKERLEEMLENASFAFLIMTAEDEHADETFHARENVIHEIGLFQGKLGFKKAIVLLEEGCKEFSNITGLGQIRFPKNNISAVFEDIRRVLEREGII